MLPIVLAIKIERKKQALKLDLLNTNYYAAMKEFVTELYQQLEKELEHIELTTSDRVERSKIAFRACEQAMTQLKAFLTTYTFNSSAEEIYFFKELKPKFYCKLIYHLRLFEIETKKPIGIPRLQKKYLSRHLAAIKRRAQDNVTFYDYYRSGADYLDDAYFTRGKHDILMGTDLSYWGCDHSFCTNHDFTAAMLLADELLAAYLNAELLRLKNEQPNLKTFVFEEFGLNWAESKASFIELLYGLQTLGVFYNSKTKTKADMNQVARFFETVLQIDLGNYYRTFQEIRIRKKGRTAFLDRLREHLIQRMDEADENPRY